MENKGILIVVSGFSGAGKGTIMRALLDKYEETYALSVSAPQEIPDPGRWKAGNISSVQSKNLKK